LRLESHLKAVTDIFTDRHRNRNRLATTFTGAVRQTANVIKFRILRRHCSASLPRGKTVKTIRKIKIMLTTREVLVSGADGENTASETDGKICPVCHSPLNRLDPLISAVAELTETPDESKTAPAGRPARAK
jgi:hypothetical protein